MYNSAPIGSSFARPPSAPYHPPHAHPKPGRRHRASKEHHKRKAAMQFGLELTGFDGPDDVVQCNGVYLRATKSDLYKGAANGSPYFIHLLQDRYLYCDKIGHWRVTKGTDFSGLINILYSTRPCPSPLGPGGSWKDLKTSHTCGDAKIKELPASTVTKMLQNESDFLQMVFKEKSRRKLTQYIDNNASNFPCLASTKSMLLERIKRR